MEFICWMASRSFLRRKDSPHPTKHANKPSLIRYCALMRLETPQTTKCISVLML